MHRMSRDAVWSWTVCVIVTALVISVFRAGLQAGSVMGGRLEIFSWWTWGREADGLNALFEIFRQRYPDVAIVNAAIAGGTPEGAAAILKARMQQGHPPDSFQAHGGEELTSPWVVTGHMEPITQVFESEGWLAVFPRTLVNIVTYQGDQYSVPVSVHRGNVLWYNKKIFDDNKLAAPTSWDEFFKVANTLRAKGITPLALGDQNKWEAAHLLEDVLLGALGPVGYRGLWTGKTSWTGDTVKRALETYAKVLEYVNGDHANGTWDSAAQMLIDGKAAMTVMGDWASCYFIGKGWTPGTDYGYVTSFATSGVILVISSTFSLPYKSQHHQPEQH